MEEEMKKMEFVDAIAFDLDAIMNFVFQNKQKDKSSEIREVWDKNGEGNLEMVQKSMAEVRSDNLGAIANIRYDLVKILIEEVASIGMINDNVDDVELNEGETYAGVPMVTELGQMLALNTLQKEGMIINLDSKKAENE